jgi:hypothetical protein
MENQHPVLTQLNQEVSDLKQQVEFLRSERQRSFTDHENDVESIRAILIDALINQQRYDVSLESLARSVADVLGILLQKEITVSIPLTVEATMLVPANFDVRDLDIHDVGMDAFNTDVEDFSVQSWDIGHIEEI